MNSTGQAIDPEGRVHVITMHRLSDRPVDFSGARARPDYVHYWRDKEGVWHQTSLPFGGGRPKLVFDAAGNAYLAHSGGRIASASAKAKWRDWTVIHRVAGRFTGETAVDRLRWEAEGVLSVLAQDKPASAGQGSALRVFDFRVPASPREERDGSRNRLRLP